MRSLFLAAAAFGAMAALAGGAQALETLPPAPYNPMMKHLGPVEANIYNATDMLPQGRPWFRSSGPSYGTFVDPWFEPSGTVSVRPARPAITK